MLQGDLPAEHGSPRKQQPKNQRTQPFQHSCWLQKKAGQAAARQQCARLAKVTAAAEGLLLWWPHAHEGAWQALYATQVLQMRVTEVVFSAIIEFG